MANRLSFMSANFVARELAFNMPGGWGQGERTTSEHFKPLNTFEERFDKLLSDVSALGFTAIDLWSAHLSFSWATPAHLEIAQRCLKKHCMLITSYAGGFGSDLTNFRACCVMCSHLGIPILGGMTQLIKTERAAVVETLREFGLIFGYENHPQKTPEELLELLGEGDEDVVGVALDTGWFATAGYDPEQALHKLLPRIKLIHLKDICARRAEKTGYGMIDMGHETCRYGQGIVPIAKCLAALREKGYRGGISIEHEPEQYDPSEDVKFNLKYINDYWTKNRPVAKKRLRCVIVGCGNIADHYGKHLSDYPEVEIVGAQDLDKSRAETFTQRYGGKAYGSLDEVATDPRVDCIVNLTIAKAHAEVISRSLEAGKHVYSEKPLAPNYSIARKLVELSERTKKRLACAPAGLMGESQQTAWKLLREGRIGTPRVVYAEVNWGRIESWHPSPAEYYAVGPTLDCGVYPMMLITAWFGPIRRIVAGGKIVKPDRLDKFGKPFMATAPDWQSAALEFESGVMGRLTCSFYVGASTRALEGIEVHGDDGTVVLEQWHKYSSKVLVAKPGAGLEHSISVPLVREPPPNIGVEYGRGVLELAQAIHEGRPHRNSALHAAHAVEALEAIMISTETGRTVEVKSSFVVPEPMPWAMS